MTAWFELNYTLRLLRKKIGFTAICVAVIALGLTVSIPLISFTKFTAAADLHFDGSDRLAIIMEDTPVPSVVPTSMRLDAFAYQRLKESVTSFEEFGALRISDITLSDGNVAEVFSASFMTPSFLNIPNATPLLGRTLRDTDDEPGAAPVVVISHTVWSSYYGQDTNIIGQQSRVNGDMHTIVGVMPEDFAYPYANDIWLPLQLSGNAEPGGNKSLSVVGMIESGTSFRSVDAEVKTILNSLAEEYPDFYGDRTGIVLHYTKIFNATVIPITAYLLVGLTISVLLLVSFNIGNLMIIRSNERISELAIRGAVGGSSYRIFCQVLLESFLIALTAVILGLVLGQLSLNYLVVAYPDYFLGFPYWFELKIGASDTSLTLGATALIWLFSALYPAWRASKSNLGQVLARSGVQTTNSGRLVRFLVSTELIASCFLLIMSIALATSIYFANRHDLNVRTQNLLAFSVGLSSSNYESATSKLGFLNQLQTELTGSENYKQALYASVPPGVNAPRINFALEDRQVSDENRLPFTKYVWTSSNYFDVLEAELLEGRFFDTGDNQNTAAVVVIDDLFAQQFWPDESAIGQRILFNAGENQESLTIIGIVRHILQGYPVGASRSESSIFRPFSQLSMAAPAIQEGIDTPFLFADSTALDASSIANHADQIGNIVARVDRDVPVLNLMSLTDILKLSGGPFSLFASLMLGVSVVTLVLATVGIYGVVSRSVLLRNREIGIRRAFGSSNAQVMMIFFNQALRYLVPSLIIGGTGAYLILSAAAGQLQTGNTIDSTPWVMSLVFIGLSSLVFLASYIPIKKIMGMEPGESLHYE